MVISSSLALPTEIAWVYRCSGLPWTISDAERAPDTSVGKVSTLFSTLRSMMLSNSWVPGSIPPRQNWDLTLISSAQWPMVDTSPISPMVALISEELNTSCGGGRISPAVSIVVRVWARFSLTL